MSYIPHFAVSIYQYVINTGFLFVFINMAQFRKKREYISKNNVVGQVDTLKLKSILKAHEKKRQKAVVTAKRTKQEYTKLAIS